MIAPSDRPSGPHTDRHEFEDTSQLQFLDYPLDDRVRIVRKTSPCQRCGVTGSLELRRYPLNNAVAWFCLNCGAINRSANGNLFITHNKLRVVAGIDPFWLPKVGG